MYFLIYYLGSTNTLKFLVQGDEHQPNSDHISKIRVEGNKVCLPIDVTLPETKNDNHMLFDMVEISKCMSNYKGHSKCYSKEFEGTGHLCCTSYIRMNAECGSCPFIAATSEQQILNDKIK